MNDAYVWADDAVRCYDQVVETLCEQHLDERFPGETAKQWQAVTLKALITGVFSTGSPPHPRLSSFNSKLVA